MYPCRHFDLEKGRPNAKKCPHDLLILHNDLENGEECDYWMENYDPDDVFACCLIREEIYQKDDKTINMFETLNNES